MTNITTINNEIKEVMEKIIFNIIKDKDIVDSIVRIHNSINENNNIKNKYEDYNSKYEFKDNADIIAYCINGLVTDNTINRWIKYCSVMDDYKPLLDNKINYPFEIETLKLYDLCKLYLKYNNLNYELPNIVSFGRYLQKANKYLDGSNIRISKSYQKYSISYNRGTSFVLIEINNKNHIIKNKIITTKCEYCNKEITINSNFKSKHHFCSKECYHKYQKENNKVKELLKELGHNGKEIKCQSCGNPISYEQAIKHVYQHINNPQNVKLQSIYCSKECFYNDHHRKNYAKSYIDIPESK